MEDLSHREKHNRKTREIVWTGDEIAPDLEVVGVPRKTTYTCTSETVTFDKTTQMIRNIRKIPDVTKPTICIIMFASNECIKCYVRNLESYVVYVGLNYNTNEFNLNLVKANLIPQFCESDKFERK